MDQCHETNRNAQGSGKYNICQSRQIWQTLTSIRLQLQFDFDFGFDIPSTMAKQKNWTELERTKLTSFRRRRQRSQQRRWGQQQRIALCFDYFLFWFVVERRIVRSKGEDEVVFVFVLFVLVVCRVGKKRLLDKPKRTHGRVVTGTKWCTKLSRQKDGKHYKDRLKSWPREGESRSWSCLERITDVFKKNWVNRKCEKKTRNNTKDRRKCTFWFSRLIGRKLHSAVLIGFNHLPSDWNSVRII